MKLEAIDHIKSLNLQELPSDIRDGADNTFDSEEKKIDHISYFNFTCYTTIKCLFLSHLRLNISVLLVLDSEEPPGGVTLYISNSKLNSLNVSYDISFSRAETVTLHVSCWPLWDDMLA